MYNIIEKNRSHFNLIALMQLLVYHFITKLFNWDHFGMATLLKRDRNFSFGLFKQRQCCRIEKTKQNSNLGLQILIKLCDFGQVTLPLHSLTSKNSSDNCNPPPQATEAAG